ncbi:TetR/AcrR family transcriptional regulator [Companilactobacillus sp. DQM5]|uniref:TetR/AcrR family transcriptional regulator n=1 Tax=Companilactobacillus sp. DQM5 TaxID=3463359 RepID=UPI0040595E36
MKKDELILDSAQKLFYKKGYNKAKVEDIAKEANVSKVTIFKYFESKKKLAHKVVIKAIRDGYIDFNKIVNNDSLDFKEKVKQMIEAKYKGAEEINENFRNFMLEEMQDNKGKNEILDEYNKGKKEFWNNFFREGRKSGELRPEVSNKTILVFINMLINYVVNDEQKNSFDMIELIDLFFYGVMKND